MKRIKTYLIVLCITALPFLPIRTQSQGEKVPSEFSPLTTSRPSPVDESYVPATKFVKIQDAVPNKYIVVLNDDVVPVTASLKAKQAQIAAIAEDHAKGQGGKVGFIYETALTGYSIELPSEKEAIALSESSEVKWVEEVTSLQLASTQFNPPWGIDRIDQTGPVGPVMQNGTTNGTYNYISTGASVNAYVLDTGIRKTHQEFGGRASIAADFIAGSGVLDSCIFPKPTATDNDCGGHGTHVAGTLGGATYGVAKSVNILSVKVCTSNFFGCPTDIINAGINFVTNQHNANPSTPALANMSISGPISASMDTAVQNSINSGVTYIVAAGNFNDDARFYSPAHVSAALTVASTDAADVRVSSCQPGNGSDFGSIDLFAPGYYILSAGSNSDTTSFINCGTSMASPHVAGTVALYLQGRASMSLCSNFPIQGPSSPLGGLVSTCPDRVTRFIKSNSNLSKVINPGGTDHNGVAVTSPNRLDWSAWIPATTNLIDNQRFFVWSHYADFLVNQPEPDEGGLNFWTGQITACGTGFNDNNSCTHGRRIDVSRAFWVAAFPSLFTGNGSALTDNSQFVHKLYEVYLRRSVPDSDGGFQFWLNDLNNNYGNPANQAGINHHIDAFLGSGEYRQRFGQP